jgi:short-subunit dehydrogenase
MPENLLIVGATSAIAEAFARRYAPTGASFYLAARDQDKLSAVADDLRVRGAGRVETHPFDAADASAHAAVLEGASSHLASLDIAVVAYGTLPNQEAIERDPDGVAEAFETNATSVVTLLTRLGNLFEAQGAGTIVVISSVAGDRGRPSNYVYGAAKGAVSLFAQGLRARLARAGVHVLTVKPGLVDTPMTAHLPKNALFATPEQVAEKIHRAIAREANVVYAPGFWRPVMAGVRAIPERLFKRMRL